MKTLLPLLLVFLSVLRLSAGDMFQAVEINAEWWEVTFPDKGVRFRLIVDDTDRGVSGYTQTLRMKRSERLTLIEKHSKIEIRPAEQNGQQGIEIKTIFSGTEGIAMTFEPEHK